MNAYLLDNIQLMDMIKIKNARVHNLKGVDVNIPRDALTVVTGPSGSGKSSLAFDTLYAEGQRRYIESLSSYSRQFLGQMQAPDVESITGLSPAIAIDQKSSGTNPRSTVGTSTEVYDYMRVLYARLGLAHCPDSHTPLRAQTPRQIIERLLGFAPKTKLQILAPVLSAQKGERKDFLAKLLSMGFARVRFNGEIVNLDDSFQLPKNKNYNLDVVVDRIVMKEGIEQRLSDSVEQALKLGEGKVIVLANEEQHFFSRYYISESTGKSYPELSPKLFSFNSPLGACPHCNGMGQTQVFDEDKYMPDHSLSLAQGAILPLGKKGGFYYQMVANILDHEGLDENISISKWPKKVLNTILYGSEKEYTYNFVSENSQYTFKKAFVGIRRWLEKRYQETASEKIRSECELYMHIERCAQCLGERLSPFARSVTVGGQSIMQVCELSLDSALEFFKSLRFEGQDLVVAEKLLKEIISRLQFLNDVGLSYLSLSRSSNTLSGGESQRIRLATQIGSALSGVLYVLDEPSIGLHQRDNDRLIQTLLRLRDIGNTVIVVEHDEDTMRNADYLIDIGPGAGVHGGEVVAQGDLKSFMGQNSVTAQFLNKTRRIEIPKRRRSYDSCIKLTGVNKNNLKNLSVDFPLGVFTVISGVSGSGKSTLVHDALSEGILRLLRKKKLKTNIVKRIQGYESIDQLIQIDQSPIGRTPKSNPATYTKLFDPIRTLFSSTSQAKVHGYKPGRFSFNVPGGRCENCEGNGSIKVEMNLLPDVYVTCHECQGKRYNQQTLNVSYRGKNIADVLDMTIEEAHEFFRHHKKIHRTLKVLCDIGLGYIKLGQPSPTLSGGEAQRMKLSRELGRGARGKIFYVLDEPTTGLHFDDIRVLLNALNELVEQGHSVLVIEHNLDVIKCADVVIDLGPEGGVGGGEVVAWGTPEEVAKQKRSLTGQYLKKML